MSRRRRLGRFLAHVRVGRLSYPLWQARVRALQAVLAGSEPELSRIVDGRGVLTAGCRDEPGITVWLGAGLALLRDHDAEDLAVLSCRRKWLQTHESAVGPSRREAGLGCR